MYFIVPLLLAMFSVVDLSVGSALVPDVRSVSPASLVGKMGESTRLSG